MVIDCLLSIYSCEKACVGQRVQCCNIWFVLAVVHGSGAERVELNKNTRESLIQHKRHVQQAEVMIIHV